MRYALVFLMLPACVGLIDGKDGKVDDNPPEDECTNSCPWGAFGNPCFYLWIGCNGYEQRCWIQNDGCVIDPDSCAMSCTGECGYNALVGDDCLTFNPNP
jgi:hypothetical protein